MNHVFHPKSANAIAMLLIACCVPISSEGAVIRFRASVEVDAALVTLGHVAEVLDNNAARADELKRISLTPAPPPGREVLLDFAMIRSRMQARGVDLAGVEFSGNSVVSVRAPAPEYAPRPAPPRQPVELKPSTRSISETHVRRAERLINEAVRQSLQHRAPELGEVALSVDLPNEAVPLVLDAEASGFQVLGGGPPWDVPRQMTIRLMDRNEELHDVPVVVTIEKLPYVVAARYSVARGQILQASDLTLTQVEEAGDALRRTEEAVGKEVKTTIRQGEPILRQDIRSQPLIRNNDIVTVTIRLGGIRVQRQFRARTDGALGDMVNLLTLDGREQLMGRVTGFHEAEVLATGAPSPRSSTISDDTGVIQFVPTEANVNAPETPSTTQPAQGNASLRYLPKPANRTPAVIANRRILEVKR